MNKYLIHRINYFLFFILFTLTVSVSYGGKVDGPNSLTFSGGSTYCQNKSSLDLNAEITLATQCGSGQPSTTSYTISIYSNTTNSTVGGTLETSCTDQTSCSYTPPTSTCGDLYYYAIVSWNALDCLSSGSITSSTTQVTIDCDASCGAKSTTDGIIVNEFSNGDSGDREFMEFLVVGTPCSTVDLRGWIFDDNNGLDDAICQGFGKNFTNVGIAAGHTRFRHIARWSAVPVGSLILIYNNTDKNIAITLADDPSDSNSDKVYVLPINDSGLEQLTTNPISSGDCSYTTGSYSSPASWGPIGLRNTGDACQTRSPDGVYFHGFSYGINSADMTGGPDNLYFNINGTQTNFYLNCGYHTFIADYSTGDGDFSDGSSDETPGLPNNALNQSYIDYYLGTDGCGVKDACVTIPLSSNKIQLKGKQKSNLNMLTWVDNENLMEEYVLQSSLNGKDFADVIEITNNNSQVYTYSDDAYSTINYYRLKLINSYGGFKYSNTIVLKDRNNTSTFKVEHIYPNPSSDAFQFDIDLSKGNQVDFKIYNTLGEEVLQNTYTSSQAVKINTSNLSNGVYQLIFNNGVSTQNHKLIIRH